MYQRGNECSVCSLELDTVASDWCSVVRRDAPVNDDLVIFDSCCWSSWFAGLCCAKNCERLWVRTKTINVSRFKFELIDVSCRKSTSSESHLVQTWCQNSIVSRRLIIGNPVVFYDCATIRRTFVPGYAYARGSAWDDDFCQINRCIRISQYYSSISYSRLNWVSVTVVSLHFSLNVSSPWMLESGCSQDRYRNEAICALNDLSLWSVTIRVIDDEITIVLLDKDLVAQYWRSLTVRSNPRNLHIWGNDWCSRHCRLVWYLSR